MFFLSVFDYFSSISDSYICIRNNQKNKNKVFKKFKKLQKEVRCLYAPEDLTCDNHRNITLDTFNNTLLPDDKTMILMFTINRM